MGAKGITYSRDQIPSVCVNVLLGVVNISASRILFENLLVEGNDSTVVRAEYSQLPKLL